MKRGILLIGHGSRDATGNGQFLALAAAVAGQLSDVDLEPCFLDHATPGIAEGIARLTGKGARDIGVLPLFLFAAGHAKADVPAHLDHAVAHHPGVKLRYGSVLGVHRTLVKDCATALRDVDGGGDRAATAILLVGRGSSDPEANADLAKVARLLWEETRYGLVETAYSDVTRPTIDEGMARCLRLGARRVILLPYFLFRGVLMDRLVARVARWQAEMPEVAFTLAGRDGLATFGGVVDIAVRRAREALGAPAWEASNHE